MRVILRMIKVLEWGNIPPVIKIKFTKVVFKMINLMALENKRRKKSMYTLVTSTKEKNKGMELWSGIMVRNMMATGKTINLRGKALLSVKYLDMKESGKMGFLMGREYAFGMMVEHMKDNM